MSLCVIYNPVAARGRAPRRVEQLTQMLFSRAEFWPTTGPRHAEELALEAVRAGHTEVAAAGGDGTVHEVANGILRSGSKEVVFCIIPIGSANDYAFCL